MRKRQSHRAQTSASEEGRPAQRRYAPRVVTFPWKLGGRNPWNTHQKGISLGKAAMRAVEARLERHPELLKYDIVINPAPTS